MEKSEMKIEFTLSFSGLAADDHMVNFEDMLVALGGFHRALALTTHLILNGEVITDASSLKGAKIYATPPERGSWRMTAIIAVSLVGGASSLVGGLSALGTVSRDTVTGHLVYSAYDYAVKKSLGFHVNYDQSLYQQYLENQNIIPSQDNERLLNDLAVECKSSIVDIHCPIYSKKSASSAVVTVSFGQESKLAGEQMNMQTYNSIVVLQDVLPPIKEKIEITINNINEDDGVQEIKGSITRFNVNTFKGRILNVESKESMNFELSSECRGDDDVDLIIKSLSANATQQVDKQQGIISCTIKRNIGRVKNYTITSINRE